MEFGDIAPLLRKQIADLEGIRRNTSNAGCCTADTSASGSTSIPAGFASIAITKTSSSGMVVITLSDGSTYPLTMQGEVFIDAGGNKSLPAYTITTPDGATWKWHGIK